MTLKPGQDGESTVRLNHPQLRISGDISVLLLTLFLDLKYDNCGVPGDWQDEYEFCRAAGDDSNNGTCSDDDDAAPDDYDWSTSKTAERYNMMRDALQQQNRTILYSLCDWGYANVTTWGNETGASWRISGDITRKLYHLFFLRRIHSSSSRRS